MINALILVVAGVLLAFPIEAEEHAAGKHEIIKAIVAFNYSDQEDQTLLERIAERLEEESTTVVTQAGVLQAVAQSCDNVIMKDTAIATNNLVFRYAFDNFPRTTYLMIASAEIKALYGTLNILRPISSDEVCLTIAHANPKHLAILVRQKPLPR